MPDCVPWTPQALLEETRRDCPEGQRDWQGKRFPGHPGSSQEQDKDTGLPSHMLSSAVMSSTWTECWTPFRLRPLPLTRVPSRGIRIKLGSKQIFQPSTMQAGQRSSPPCILFSFLQKKKLSSSSLRLLSPGLPKYRCQITPQANLLESHWFPLIHPSFNAY